MQNQPLSAKVLMTFIEFIKEEEAEGITQKQFRVESTLPLAYLMFIIGAIITKLEPKKLKSISSEMRKIYKFDTKECR